MHGPLWSSFSTGGWRGPRDFLAHKMKSIQLAGEAGRKPGFGPRFARCLPWQALWLWASFSTTLGLTSLLGEWGTYSAIQLLAVRIKCTLARHQPCAHPSCYKWRKLFVLLKQNALNYHLVHSFPSHLPFSIQQRPLFWLEKCLGLLVQGSLVLGWGEILGPRHPRGLCFLQLACVFKISGKNRKPVSPSW